MSPARRQALPTHAASALLNPADHSQFAIGFDRRDLPRLHELWDEIVLAERWSEGEMTARFEAAWSELHGLGSVATGGWSGAALAALDFAGVRGEKVLCPSNTFMATPLAIMHSGAEPVFVDCNREDLCMSFEDFERKAEEHRPRAAVLVQIGGPHRLRGRADRGVLPRARDLPARGLRPRARRPLG